jgi:iron complex transport system ATP-binding protein
VNNTIFQLVNVSLIRGNTIILDKISLSLNHNEDCIILGRNGSGKSSLINLIYGYNWCTEGDVFVFGNKFGEFPLKEVQAQIGIVESSHQETRLQRGLSIKDIISTGFFSTIGYYNELSKEEEKTIDEIIQRAKWIKDPDQRYDTLSSGEKKKTLLLRALVKKPRLLILDEPCSSLDIPSREDFLNLLSKLKKEYNFTTLYITHKTEEILPFFQKIILLKDGKLLTFGNINDCMTNELLSELYGLPLSIHKIESTYFTTVRRE